MALPNCRLYCCLYASLDKHSYVSLMSFYICTCIGSQSNEASQMTGSQSKESSGDTRAAEKPIYRSADHSHALYELSATKSFSLVDVEAKVVMLGALGIACVHFIL